MAVPVCEYTKRHLIVYFILVNCIYMYSILIKLALKKYQLVEGREVGVEGLHKKRKGLLDMDNSVGGGVQGD